MCCHCTTSPFRSLPGFEPRITTLARCTPALAFATNLLAAKGDERIGFPRSLFESVLPSGIRQCWRPSWDSNPGSHDLQSWDSP